MSARAVSPTLTRRDVRARRLRRHALTAEAPDPSPAGVVAAMHGAHAQVLSAAELSVALRLAGSTRATVRDALWSDHTLTKTLRAASDAAPGSDA